VMVVGERILIGNGTNVVEAMAEAAAAS
jgi:hypothetical protein